jgi:predicted aspartyl protease
MSMRDALRALAEQLYIETRHMRAGQAINTIWSVLIEMERLRSTQAMHETFEAATIMQAAMGTLSAGAEEARATREGNDAAATVLAAMHGHNAGTLMRLLLDDSHLSEEKKRAILEGHSLRSRRRKPRSPAPHLN